MCVIIDVHLSHMCLCGSPTNDFRPLMNWVEGRHGSLAIGGHLTEELTGNNNVRRYLLRLEQMGKVMKYRDDSIIREQSRLENAGGYVSDDPHILALAIVSGARVLCSHDQDLHTDFRNAQLINQPRGSIYQNATHNHLLRNPNPCKPTI